MITELHEHTHAENRFSVVSTVERLNAEPGLTGKGITIALLDSGFYPHPDLTEPENRIAAFVDVTRPDAVLDPREPPEGWAWHGTMTSVTCAGNGYLSGGVYRGLASEARVVLVKVSDHGRISESNIAAGLEWVLAHREKYGIRIVSISLGGDEDAPYEQNRVDRLAEDAVRAGLVVVVAAGNSGCTIQPNVVPPANAPSVITVGGYDDGNRVHPEHIGLYCSSYGLSVDGILKPEILAPAIWVAAPILPLTDAYLRAEALSEMAAVPDFRLPSLALKLAKQAGLPAGVDRQSPDIIRGIVDEELKASKTVATHYQHVDGTSFAAPIVASLVAQMLEANPTLTPGQVKQILIDTAQRLGNEPLLRQGYGVITARAALQKAREEAHACDLSHFRPPRAQNGKLVFQYHNDSARSVSVAGDFNNWDAQAMLKQNTGASWTLEVPMPAPGRYRYKYVVDGAWIEDPANGMKDPDGYGGLNSIVNLK